MIDILLRVFNSQPWEGSILHVRLPYRSISFAYSNALVERLELLYLRRCLGLDPGPYFSVASTHAYMYLTKLTYDCP